MIPPRTPPALSRSRRAALAAIAALALSACGEATAPLPAEGAPDELAFNVSAAEAWSSTNVQLDGAAVVVTHVRRSQEEGVRTQRVRVVPSAQDWEAFWAAVDDAGVRRWTGQYVAEGYVDGVGWSLRLARGGVVTESHGVNAYPDRDGREHEIFVTADFRAFLDALGTLTRWEF